MTRGEIWMLDFGYPFGSEPGYLRPVVLVQTDELNNSLLNTTLVVPVTSNLRLADYEGNVFMPKDETNLPKDSVALAIQVTVVDKSRLVNFCGKVSTRLLGEVAKALKFVLEI